jgi:hypothetical protein
LADTWAVSAGNLAKLRTDAQHARPYLTIAQPATVLKATLSALPTASDGSVADLPITVVSGSAAAVIPDQTVLIMDSGETEVLGVCRVRKASTSTHLYISEESNDTYRRWSVGNKLLVLDEFAVWPRHLRVVDTTTFYADWEVEYSDQHAHPTPVIRFGPPVIPAWIVGASASVTFDASYSAIPYGSDTLASWSWGIDTGTGSVEDETTSAPTFQFSTTGRKRVHATATSSASKAWTRYAWPEIYGADRLPNEDFELTSDPEGSAEQGGWTFGVKMYSGATVATVRDRAAVVLWSDDYYSNVKESIGPVPGRAHIVAWGWIAGETIEWDAEGGYVTFEVKSADHFLQACRSFPSGLEDTDFADNGGGAPSRWTEMEDLTVDKSLWHFCHWRSTLDRACDCFFTGDTRQAATIESAGEDLWSQLLEFSYSTILALPAFDRYGRLWVRGNQHHVPLDERDAIPTVIALTDDDHAAVTITRRSMPRYSQVAISGVRYVNDVSVPVGAYSPGKVPAAPAEEAVEETELMMGTQAEANLWAGLIAGSGDREIDAASIDIPRCYRVFDVAPHAWVTISVAAADTTRGVTYTNERLIPRSVRYSWDKEAGCWGASLECEGEGTRWGAVRMDDFPNETLPPEEPPEEPPPPPPPPWEPPEEPEEPGTGDAVVVTVDDVRVTADLSEASPTWISIGGPSAPVDSDLAEGTTKLIVIQADGSVQVCEDVTAETPAWSEVWDATQLTGGTFGALCRVRFAPGSSDIVYVLGYGEREGANNPFVLRSSNGGQTWAESWIDETLAETPYTVTTSSFSQATDVYAAFIEPVIATMPHTRYGLDKTSNPYLIAFQHTPGEFSLSGGSWHRDWVTPPMGDDGIASDAALGSRTSSGAIFVWFNDLLTGSELDTAIAWADAVFGAGGYTGETDHWLHMPNEANRVNVVFGLGTWAFGVDPGEYSDVLSCTSWVVWDEPHTEQPTALDVARGNPNWVYVGTADKVWKSTDGGFTWALSLEDHGSNDIHVDPGPAGVYYHWAADGGLELVSADTVTPPDLDTEAPVSAPLRLARDLNTGRLWGINAGATLKCRNNAAWSDQQTGLTGGRGLHAYVGGKLIFVDSGHVYISDDYGETVVDKTGAWAMSAGVNAHRLPA